MSKFKAVAKVVILLAAVVIHKVALDLAVVEAVEAFKK